MVHRKQHSNSWETALTDEQREQAFAYARDMGYDKARLLIAKEMQIAAPSLAGMSRFYERMARLRQERAIEKALVDVGNLDQLAAKLPSLTAAKKAALEKAYLDALITGDPDRIKLFGELLLKHQAQDTDAARLQLQVTKYQDAVSAARAEIEGAKSKGGITEETLEKIDRILLGV